MSYLILFTVCLLIFGIAALWISVRLRVASGLPEGEVVSTDMGNWRALDKPLVSHRFGLVGKPDYLVRVREGRREVTIPVEVKSRTRPKQPFDSHILQLATYCLLIEDHDKQVPPYGYLRYADATVKIPFTESLRQQVLHTAKAIRQARRAPEVSRSHEDAGRCMGCGYQHKCGEGLEF